MSDSPDRRLPGFPRHATVVSYVALFVALSGTAWAAATIGSNDIKDNAVKSRHIKNGEVQKPDLATDSVGSGKVIDNSIASNDILDNSIGSADVADEALGSTDLAPDSVGASELQTAAVGSNELGANAVRASELGDGVVERPGTPVTVNGGAAQNSAYVVEQAVASCNAGEELIGGMGEWDPNDNASSDYELWIAEIRPNFSGESVTVDGGNDSGVAHDLVPIAVCLQG